MTDFTLSSGSYMRPYKARNGGSFPIRHMALSTGISSNVIRVGTVVGLDQNTTNGASLIVPSSVTSNALVSTAVVGVAAEGPGATAGGLSSTNVTGTLIPVWDADPQVEFRAHTRNGLLNSTLIGQIHEILRDTTLNIELINVGASCLTTPINHVLITSLIDAAGDSGGAVGFKFIAMEAGTATSSLSTGRRLAFFV